MGQVRTSAKLAAASRLAVVADTHSQPHANTHRLLAALAPDAILHAGDIGDLAVIDELAEIAPVYAVRGNIDTHAAGLPDVLVLDAGALRIFITHIGVAGPRLRGEVAKQARDEGFEEIADWFETLAKAERSHANRFQKALDTL